MNAHDDIPVQDARGLRKFGVITGLLFVLLFAGIPWVRAHSTPVWPWVVAALLWGPALVVPMALRPICSGWMRLGSVLGFINTRVILGLFFLVILLPVAVVVKVLGKDALKRGFDANARSYRTASKARPPTSMEVPF